MIRRRAQFSGVKDTWARLGRIDLASKPFLLTLLGAHVFSVFGFELGRVGSEPFLTLAIALVAEVVFWGVYLTLYLVQLWWLRGNASVLLKVCVILFSNTARTFTLEFALFQFDLLDEIRFADRFLGDATIILMLLIGVAYIQVALVELGAQEAELQKAKDQLRTEVSATKQSAETADEALREKANQVLGAQLSALAEYLQSAKNPEAVRLTSEIQNLINEKVRPLSADLWGRLQRMEVSAQADPETSRRSWPKRLYPAADFRPQIVMGFAGLNIFLTTPGLSSWTLTFGLVPWMLLFPLLGVAQIALVPKRKNLGMFAGSMFVSLMTVISWGPAIAYLAWSSQLYPELLVLIFTSTTLLIFTTVAAGIWSAFKRERLTYLEEIEALNKERSRQLALVDQAVWVARRNWSYLVHGTVQGALTVAISRVQLSNELTPELVSQVLGDIERAKAALNQNEGLTQGWSEVWPQIEQTWEGVCKVTHSVTPEAQALLGSNDATSTCVAEISKELVSNAFRHGKASEVNISISTETPQDLRIISTNNGFSVDTDRQHGIGSEMFDELTAQWTWNNTPRGPVFTASVPVATNP